MPPRVTVYIPVHNYGKFLRQAIKSVLAQRYEDWELIVINDGSTDQTLHVLKSYSQHPKITIVHQQRKGLTVSNNVALRMARGEYIIRLDADDYFDENALLVLANVLDTHPEVGLVYSDYYLVNELGDVLEIVRRKKVREEVQLLDLPAHGACTMIRRSCLLALGGYSENTDRQDGYDLWIRVVNRYHVYNVNLPLFYYRRHGKNLTRDGKSLLAARHAISRAYIKERFGDAMPETLAIIPVRSVNADAFDAPLGDLAGKPLLQYTLDEALKAAPLGRIVVTTDDEAVLAYAQAIPRVTALPRPAALSRPNTRIEPTVHYVLDLLRERDGYAPVAVMLLYINTPLRLCEHIEQAIDTMLVFQTDSVVSVCEDVGFHYLHGRHGLVPIQPKGQLRLERDALYEENGAVYLSRRSAVTRESFLGKRVGHVMMLREESAQIDSPFERWLVERILLERRGAHADRAA